MRVYLDSCCIQRPFDNQTQPRIRVESEAVLAVLTAVQAGDIYLLNSEALEYEIQRIPDEGRHEESLAILSLAQERLQITSEVETVAEQLESHGVRPMDAVHLALASSAGVDFFVTCDDRLLQKAPNLVDLDCKVVSILNLIQEVT